MSALSTGVSTAVAVGLRPMASNAKPAAAAKDVEQDFLFMCFMVLLIGCEVSSGRVRQANGFFSGWVRSCVFLEITGKAVKPIKWQLMDPRG
jgi:hypothetical protein